MQLKHLKTIIMSFILILLVLIPPFASTDEPIDLPPDDEPYHYWSAPEGSFGMQEMKTINWSYFQNWSTDNLLVTLHYKSGGDWIDCSEYLNTLWVWDETYYKSIINFTTPVEAKYRLQYDFNESIVSYVNKTDKDVYWLNYTVDENETYNCFFNWSDVDKSNWNVKSKLKVNQNKNYFYCEIDSKHNIDANTFIEIDPTFGYTGTGGGGVVDFGDKIIAEMGEVSSTSTADNITAYVATDGAHNMKGALYWTSNYTLIATTEQKSVSTSSVYTWMVFDFTGAVNLQPGINYSCSIWSEQAAGIERIQRTGLGSGESWENVSTYNGYPNPVVATSKTYDVSVYCSYTAGVWSNSNPINSNPDPQNGNTSVSLTPTLRIQVNDVDMANQSVNTTWRSNSSGSWVDFNTNTSSSNTTFYQSFTNASAYNTKYWWSVNTSDGNGGWDNDTFYFTTDSDPSGISYYVKNAGDDTKDGLSDANAWQTIGKVNTEMLAAAVIEDGDDVYFKRGDTFTDTWLEMNDCGTADKQMIIGAYGTGVNPIFSLSGEGFGIHWNVASGQNVRFENITIDGPTQGMSFYKTNTQNIEIFNMTVRNTGANGILCYQIDGLLVENCTVHDCNLGGILNYGSSTYGITNTMTRNCTAYNINTDGFSVHPGSGGNSVSPPGDNHVYINCVSYDCGEDGYDFTGGDHILVKDCEAYNNSASSILLDHGPWNITIDNFYGHDQGNNNVVAHKCNNVIIRNSVFQNFTNADMYIYGTLGTPGEGNMTNLTVYNNDFITNYDESYVEIFDEAYDITFKNNIFYSVLSNAPSGAIWYVAGVTPTTSRSNWSSNMYWRGDGTSGTWWYYGGASHNLATWNANSRVSNEVVDDPEFADAEGKNYNLNSTSPCIDAGDWLTRTDGSGTSDWITVDEASYFSVGIASLDVDGDNIFVGSDTDLVITEINYANESFKVNRSITWADNEDVSLSSYNDTAPDIGAREYGVLGNTNPTITNEVPSDGSTGISLQPTCNITVNDADGDTMDVTFASDYSGSWVNYQTNSTVGNGTYRWDFTGANTGSTLYNWRVYCNDGTTNISETYDFTTLWINTAPSLSDENPTNASVDASLLPQLNITVTDVDGNNSEVYWYTNASGSWYLMQTNSSVLDETVRLMSFTNASVFSTKYWWRISANDTLDNTTEIYHFTTLANTAPLNTNPNPTNGGIGVALNPTLQITISDINGHIMNQTFWSNASGIWAEVGFNNNSPNATVGNSSGALFNIYSTVYYWSSNVTDGYGGWDNDTYHFKTTGEEGNGGSHSDENDISIYVYDDANIPVFNAFVTIYDGITLIDSDYTDASGLFETVLDDGIYTVEIIADGYDTLTTVIVVDTDENFVFCLVASMEYMGFVVLGGIAIAMVAAIYVCYNFYNYKKSSKRRRH